MTAEHPSNDRSCPTFIREKTIMVIKTIKRCTIKESREEYNNSGHLYSQYITIQKPKKSIAQIIKEKIANEIPSSTQNPFMTQKLSELNQYNKKSFLSTTTSVTQELAKNSTLHQNSSLLPQTSNIQQIQTPTNSQQQNNIPNHKTQTDKISTNTKQPSTELTLPPTSLHDQADDSSMDCSEAETNYLIKRADKLLVNSNTLSSSLQTQPTHNKNKPSI